MSAAVSASRRRRPGSARALSAQQRALIPVAVLLLACARALTAMLFAWARGPGLLDWLVAVVAVAAAVTLAVTGPVGWQRWSATVVATVYWLMPVISAVAHGQPLPVVPLALAAVVAVLLLGPPLSPAALRSAIWVGALVVGVSLLAGALTALHVTDGAFHTLAGYERAVFDIPALRGITWHPNTLGGIAGVTLLLAIGPRALPGRATRWLVVALSAVALLWSQSRSGLVATAAALGALGLVRSRPARRTAVAVAALALAMLPVLLQATLGTMTWLDALVTGRQTAWRAALVQVGQEPLLGRGVTAFNRAFWRHQPPQPWQPAHAHNQVLQTLAQTGWAGFAALLALAVVAVVVVRRRSPLTALLPVTLVVFLAVSAAVEVPLGLTYFPIASLLPILAVTGFAYAGPRPDVSRGQSPPPRG